MPLLLGLWMAMGESEKRGLKKDIFIDLVLFAIPIAIICATDNGPS
jgi:phosphatidylglycerol:prolipoprotein diacylglycerol transferase